VAAATDGACSRRHNGPARRAIRVMAKSPDIDDSPAAKEHAVRHHKRDNKETAT
jgi:hypothetical protein